jgi:hypothetical protein
MPDQTTGDSFVALGHKSATNTKHLVVIDEVIAWMILNPGVSVSKASHAMGGPIKYSTLWLRQLISTDAFKARLAEKQKDCDAALLIPQLREKLHAVTEAAVERLGDMIPVSTDPEFVLDAAEMLLKTHYQLDASAKTTRDQVTSPIQVDHATIIVQQERERMLAPRQKGEVIDVEDHNQGRLAAPRRAEGNTGAQEAPREVAGEVLEEPTSGRSGDGDVSLGAEPVDGATRDTE